MSDDLFLEALTGSNKGAATKVSGTNGTVAYCIRSYVRGAAPSSAWYSESQKGDILRGEPMGTQQFVDIAGGAWYPDSSCSVGIWTASSLGRR